MKYFDIDEFKCSCPCQAAKMRNALLVMLDDARDIAGVPFNITSGYRCKKHNERVGGVTGSAHRRGLAVDIACPNNHMRAKIIHGLINAGFNRIGIAKDFIHVDCDTSKPEWTMWLY